MDHVSEHCNLYKPLPDYQLAYCNDYSCETAIVKLVNDLLWAMKKQQVTAIMAPDLSAAFDTVDHKILLNVLKHNFGLEDTVLNWFDSFIFILKDARLTLEKNIHQNKIVYLKGPVQEHKYSIYTAAQYKK